MNNKQTQTGVLEMNKMILTVLAALSLTFAARANEEQPLTDKVPSVIKVSQALSAYKDGKAVYRCSEVTLQENKKGTGLSFKKVKGSKDILTLGYDMKSASDVLNSSYVLKCSEVEPNFTKNGINFKNK